MRRHRRLLALAVMGALVLSGCASIPREGGVQRGEPAESAGEPVVDFVAAGPVAGASPEDIVTGFLEAGASPRDNYAVAREYLANDFATRWMPDRSVTIDSADIPEVGALVGDADGGEVAVVSHPLAEVDGTGAYREFDTEEPLTLRFGLVRTGGEWRIREAPDGVLVTESIFAQIYAAHPVSFFGPAGSLVPDLRWFPSRATMGTRVVAALLGGPSPWLERATSSAFPAGMTLVSESVPVQNRTAMVELRSDVAVDATTAARMQQQLTASLASIAPVSSVRLTINGVVHEDAPAGVPAPRVDSRALVLRDGLFGFLSGDGVDRLPALSDAVEALSPLAVTVAADRMHAAVRTEQGVHRVDASGGRTALVDARADLLDPAWDSEGYVWSVPRGAPGEVHVTGADGVSHGVSTAWPEATGIMAMEVSRDGARLLALLTDGASARLVAAGIERRADGMPIALGEPILVRADTEEAVDASWVDDRTAAVLLRGTEGRGLVRSQMIGGTGTGLGSVGAGVRIVGGASVGQLRVLDDTGRLSVRRVSAWQASATGVQLIAVQMGVPTG